MKYKITEAERFLSRSYYNFKLDKEDKAIDKRQDNPKSFFTFMKSKNKERTKIGPFVDDNEKSLKIFLQISFRNNTVICGLNPDQRM